MAGGFVGVGGTARALSKIYVGVEQIVGGNDEHTLLLLHGDSLTDSSPSHLSVTNSGVAVSEAQSKFGGKSLYFNGAAKLTVPGGSFTFGTSDFTVDTWVYPEAVSTDNFFFSGDTGGAFFCGRSNRDSTIGVGRATVAWDTKLSGALPAGVWSHVAVVRSSGRVYLFINGELQGSAANSVSYGMGGGTASVGAQGTGYFFKGYIEELRVSDVARWTSNFTPPTEPYNSTSKTSVARDVTKAYIGVYNIASLCYDMGGGNVPSNSMFVIHRAGSQAIMAQIDTSTNAFINQKKFSDTSV